LENQLVWLIHGLIQAIATFSEKDNQLAGPLTMVESSGGPFPDQQKSLATTTECCRSVDPAVNSGSKIQLKIQEQSREPIENHAYQPIQTSLNSALLGLSSP